MRAACLWCGRLKAEGGVKFLLIGKPEELTTLPVGEHVADCFRDKPIMRAWPVGRALRPSGASSGEFMARLLFWRSCNKSFSNSRHLILSCFNAVSSSPSFVINSMTRATSSSASSANVRSSLAALPKLYPCPLEWQRLAVPATLSAAAPSC